MKDLDLSNAEGLDESITENYSAIAPRLLATKPRGTAQVVTATTLADAALALPLAAQDADREEIGDGFL
jgi:hypothetical protein